MEVTPLCRKWQKTGLLDEHTSIEDKEIRANELELMYKRPIPTGKSIFSRLKEYETKFKVKFHIPNWVDSRFQERLLRFGVEFREKHPENPQLDLVDPYDSLTQTRVRESFAYDLIQIIDRHHEMYKDNLDIFPKFLTNLANRYKTNCV